MRVALVSQLPLALDSGGLEVQALATARALGTLGIEVELLDPWRRGFEADLLHCFGSEYQSGEIVVRAKSLRIPIVVSAVFAPHRWRGFYRLWKLADPLVPMKTSFGIRARILHAADAVLAITRQEAHDLRAIFGIDRHKIHVIPNGVDEEFFAATAEAFTAQHGEGPVALCVASVEPMKNQLRLVEATDGTDVPLVLIGPPRAREQRYARQLAHEVERRRGVTWIRGLPHESPLLASAYATAHVHILPSLVEVQPLTVLEAAAAGANLVVSDLPTLREAFGPHAWLCNPRSVSSIRRTLLGAWRTPRGQRYTSRPVWLVSWDDVARRLIEVYERVLRTGSR